MNTYQLKELHPFNPCPFRDFCKPHLFGIFCSGRYPSFPKHPKKRGKKKARQLHHHQLSPRLNTGVEDHPGKVTTKEPEGMAQYDHPRLAYVARTPRTIRQNHRLRCCCTYWADPLDKLLHLLGFPIEFLFSREM